MNLKEICLKALESKNLSEDIKYKKRLDFELKSIMGLDEDPYFLDLYEKKLKFAENENNLLVCWLLELAPNFNIDHEPTFDQGDMVDVDIDYPSKVRTYLKEDYTPKEFGQDKVCGICTYGRLGIRSSILDVARVQGLDHAEAQAITRSLPVKDEDGEILTWEEALNTIPQLKDYLDRNPELAEVAMKISNRIRSIGVHASGLIISNVVLSDFIPLVVPKQNGPIVSAWIEGQASTDLSTVGIVKFDYLGSDTTEKIGEACHFASNLLKRYYKAEESGEIANNPFLLSLRNKREVLNKVDKISALPGSIPWSDDYYLNDPVTLEMCNRGDLKSVFQFDGSQGIRSLAKEGGVKRFEDLIAYSAIFRPSTLKLGTHKMYCKRNRGEEQATYHPLIADIVNETHGILVYQEQCMKIFNRVGKIPLKNCTELIKAISKKKEDKFEKFKDMFIENGTETLGNKKDAEDMWQMLFSFSGYGFNKSHSAAYSTVSARQAYLKANYPTCHFPGFLNTFHPTGDEDFISLKSYLSEAKKAGIKVMRPDINKSQVHFCPEDDVLYYAISKIKTIGEAAALRIQENQPYTDITDFMKKIGPDAKICQATIALGMFGENRTKQMKYFYAYKAWNKIQNDAKKKIEGLREKLAEFNFHLEITEENLTQWSESYKTDDPKKDKRAINGILRTFHTNYDKLKIPYPTINDFNEEEFEIEDQEMATLLSEPQEKADIEYLGFPWTSPIEKALKEFSNYTFDALINSERSVETVDAHILEVNKKKSKKNTDYYSVKIEDILGVSRFITLWDSDFKQFQEELKAGNIVRMKIKKPEEVSKYQSFTLAPTPNRWKMPAKHLDYRIVLVK